MCPIDPHVTIVVFEIHCDNCGMKFNLVVPENPVWDKPEYCSFCGDSIEVIDTEDE